jgi:hypothetical protein
MDLLYNYIIAEEDDVALLLNVALTSVSEDEKQVAPLSVKHHEPDTEMNLMIADKIDEQYYISRVYGGLRDMYADVLAYVKKCEHLTVCNEALKQHMNQMEVNHKLALQKIEQSSSILHKPSRFTVYEFAADDEFLFNE